MLLWPSLPKEDPLTTRKPPSPHPSLWDYEASQEEMFLSECVPPWLVWRIPIFFFPSVHEDWIHFSELWASDHAACFV